MQVGVLNHITDFGKKRANPLACYNNNLKLTDNCACTSDPSCEDTLTGAAAAGLFVSAIKFHGVTYNLASPIINLDNRQVAPAYGPIAVEDTPRLRKALIKITGLREVDPFISVEWEADVLSVIHVGACLLEEIVLSDDSVLSATRCCETATVTSWQYAAQGAIGPVGFNGSSQALANDPYDHTGDAVSDAATAAQLQADLETALTALGVEYTMVSVMVDNLLGQYTIKVMSKDEAGPTFNGNLSANCGIEIVFDCP